jgi:hypothetical protein
MVSKYIVSPVDFEDIRSLIKLIVKLSVISMSNQYLERKKTLNRDLGSGQ